MIPFFQFALRTTGRVLIIIKSLTNRRGSAPSDRPISFSPPLSLFFSPACVLFLPRVSSSSSSFDPSLSSYPHPLSNSLARSLAQFPRIAAPHGQRTESIPFAIANWRIEALKPQSSDGSESLKYNRDAVISSSPPTVCLYTCPLTSPAHTYSPRFVGTRSAPSPINSSGSYSTFGEKSVYLRASEPLSFMTLRRASINGGHCRSGVILVLGKLFYISLLQVIIVSSSNR